MSAIWNRGGNRPSRHLDPNAALSGYMEAIRRAEVAGLAPPPAALNGLGDAYLDLGDETLAGEHHLQAAEGFAAEGLYDNAIACCRKVLRRSEDHSRAGLLLGRYYAAKGLDAEALEILGAIAERRGGAGERRDALTAMQEVVRIAPESARSRERLGRLLREAGLREDALREYRAALELCLEGGDPAGAEHARTRIEALEAPVPEEEAASAPGSVPESPGGVQGRGEFDHVRHEAAEAFSAGRWADAAGAYSRLAAVGAAGSEEFAAWTESARRSGRAAVVLQSLDAVALWHLDRNRPAEAHRAAEEMLLIDPGSEAAAEEMLLIDPGNEAAMGLLERADSLLSAER